MAEDTMARGGMRWGPAATAGLIAGAIFLALELLMVPAFLGGSPWSAPRMIAAIALGPDVLPPPATFEAGIILTALIIHFLLSALYGLLLGALVRHMPMETAIPTGAVFGLVLYFVNFYIMTAVFPWFAMARNWVSVFTHIAFGMAAAWIFAARTARRFAVQF
jgi:hypothetical protein